MVGTGKSLFRMRRVWWTHGTGEKSVEQVIRPDLGFEVTLWAAADKLRGHLDAAEYKQVVLGLIFLKYISDSIEEL